MSTPLERPGNDKPSRQKAERLETRLTAEQKELLQRAASLQGRSLTDFVIESAQAAALRTVREYEILRLNARDSEAFVAALLDAPEPGERLKAAYGRYKQHTGDA
ncbi:MAG: DUF1778 domain-containing protein [Alphaproteobacteria bacterium]|nr:DUF1778 domain-containing protein [Alphaproteobacteria bacterium]MCK5622674.1 DUF1778 domain-containing protein [Alphaproteobacteria bacterium]